jgi:hypothetical protein
MILNKKKLLHFYMNSNFYFVQGLTLQKFSFVQQNRPGACIVKLIKAVIYGFRNKLRVFVHGKPFEPTLLFMWGRPGAYTIMEHLKGC